MSTWQNVVGLGEFPLRWGTLRFLGVAVLTPGERRQYKQHIQNGGEVEFDTRAYQMVARTERESEYEDHAIRPERVKKLRRRAQ